MQEGEVLPESRKGGLNRPGHETPTGPAHKHMADSTRDKESACGRRRRDRHRPLRPRTFRTLLQTRKRAVLSSVTQRREKIDGESNEPRRPRVWRCGILRWEGPLKPTRADASACKPPRTCGKNRTYLALARGFGRCGENTNESLGAWRTGHARRLGGQFLIVVPKDIAADAAKLSFVWLEVTYPCKLGAG